MLNFIRLLIWASFTLIAGSVAIIAGIYLYLAPNVSSIDGLCGARLETPLRVYTADHKLIKVFGEKRRTPVRYDEVPPSFVQAILAAEDDRFLYHYGVDIPGLLRAAGQLIATGEIKSGGSTITMQVAKNCLLSNERTFRRKFNEIFLALQIEREMSKEQILELYFNVIFLGKRAHGVQAAAERYYGKSIDQLDLAEQAMLAGLPKAPSLYNPIVNPERARQRRDWILGRMHRLGFISREAMETARSQEARARIHDFEEPQVEADYLAEMVRDWMYERHGEQAYTEGYNVITTLNTDLQTYANRAVRAGLIDYDRRHGYRGPEGRVKLPEPLPDAAGDDLWERLLAGRETIGGLIPAIVTAVDKQSATIRTRQGAARIEWDGLRWARRHIDEDTLEASPRTAGEVVSPGDIIRVQAVAKQGYRLGQLPAIQGALSALDPDNGAIRALVGGFDFNASKFNRAAQALRQPGSTFKPFIYAAALENGFTAASIFNDAPVVESFDSTSQNAHVLNNASGVNRGPTRMRVGLYKSVNTVSARVLQAVGVSATLEYLKHIGFDTAGMPRNLQLAVGGGTLKLSPLEMTTHYAKLANGGYRVDSWFIDKVLSREGEELFVTEPLQVCTDDCRPPSTPAEQAPTQLSEQAATDTADDAAPAATDATELTESALQRAILPAPRVMDAKAVYILNSLMRDVISRGTATKARALGRQDLAGKTGTTDDARNLWFSGFNRRLVATAWVGFDEEKPLGSREYGSTAALPIWIHFMRKALQGQPESLLQQPDGIVSMRINPDSGEAAAPNDNSAVFELFVEGTEPEFNPSHTAHPDSPLMKGGRPEQLF